MVQSDYANTPVAAAGANAPKALGGARTSQPTLAPSPSNNSQPNLVSPTV